MQKGEIQKYCLFIIPILFLLYSAPSSLYYVFHYPDEKYYTDSAIQMIAKGDYFTPYNADGSPRFLKPIFTYWVLIISYKIFGVSVFSSRFFFWLAGGLLVAITYLMAKSISKNRKIATTAAFLTAANPLVLLSASRSIPDILFTLFLTISAWGLLEILIAEKPHKVYYWFAYTGAALAFETKGIPAAAYVGVSILYLILNRWKRRKISNLIAIFPIVASIFIALSWFLIMYYIHGVRYFESFFADQVLDRVSSKATHFIGNTGLSLLNIIAFSMPWIIIAVSKPGELKHYISNADNTKKSVFGFFAIWIILTILMAGAVFKFYDRYILPAVPICYVMFAHIFVESETRFKTTIYKIVVLMNLLLFTLCLGYVLFIGQTPLLIFGLLIWGSILWLTQTKITQKLTTNLKIANAILLLFFGGFVILHQLLMPNLGEQLVNALKEYGLKNKEKIYVYGNIRTASNIRVHSKNDFNVISMDTAFRLPEEHDHFLVFDKRQKNKLVLNDYDVLLGSKEWSNVQVEKFPESIQPAILKIKENGKTYLIAKPK